MTWPMLAPRWFDPTLAAVFLLAAEGELVTQPGHSPFLLEIAVVAAIIVPLAWRRRAPLAVACAAMTMIVVPRAILPDLQGFTLPLFAIAVLFIAPFTVASSEPLGRAVLGLAVCIAGPCLIHALGLGSGSLPILVAMPVASWAVGRVLRVRHERAEQLGQKAERIALESDGRERLAVAHERSRVAGELHAMVAATLTAMVVQAEVAHRLLDADAAAADNAMGSIEEAGRQVLAEMRRILGVLDRDDEAPELSPQPGVGQIYALVESARGGYRHIELQVEGEPGPLPASVNLGVYRILEDALRTSEGTTQPTAVTLRFGEHNVELNVLSHGRNSLGWPTPAMCEWIALCDGTVDVDAGQDNGGRLHLNMPSQFEDALA